VHGCAASASADTRNGVAAKRWPEREHYSQRRGGFVSIGLTDQGAVAAIGGRGYVPGKEFDARRRLRNWARTTGITLSESFCLLAP
jgi:hypothetical protein